MVTHTWDFSYIVIDITVHIYTIDNAALSTNSIQMNDKRSHTDVTADILPMYIGTMLCCDRVVMLKMLRQQKLFKTATHVALYLKIAAMTVPILCLPSVRSTKKLELRFLHLIKPYLNISISGSFGWTHFVCLKTKLFKKFPSVP